MRRLLELILEIYQPLRLIPEFQVIDSLGDDWAGFVGAVSRRGGDSAHPMKHLMMISALFPTWDAFWSAHQSRPVPERSSDGEPVVLVRDKRQDIFAQLVRGDGLSLTAAGQRVGISTTTAVQWAKLHNLAYKKRSKRISEATIDQCRKGLREGESKFDVAASANVSLVTITRLLSSEPALRKTWLRATHKNRRANYRKEFEQLLDLNPGVPLQLLRKVPRNRYAWLYRHDRKWLTTILWNRVVLRKTE